MTTVLLSAGEEDPLFQSRVEEILQKRYSLVTVKEQAIKIPDRNACLALCDVGAEWEIHSGRIIVLATGDGEIPICPQDSSVAVVDSLSEAALLRISCSGLPAVTCGLSARDTVTLSSIEPDCAVINIQRTLHCFDGSLAEPQEIPVRLSQPTDNFTLMAVACVFILCGDIAGLAEIFI